MRIDDILYSQGFGTRRICAGLVQQGQVAVAGVVVTEPAQEFALTGLHFSVQGIDWPFCNKAYLMLNKPAGTECSRKPSMWPSVYSLLPAALRQRPTTGANPGVQAVGRLDQDTTGLLVLTDDGQFIHRMASPKYHVAKVYAVRTKHPVNPEQCQRLLDGVVLNDASEYVAASACEITGEYSLRLTLTQGKYHQVKRMIAAVGNRVEGLHRAQIGSLLLPPDLAPGHWRWLTASELEKLGA